MGMDMGEHRPLRIFLAAPGRDTEALRQVIEAEIERIRHSKLIQRLIQVELVRWDDPQRPIPMSWLRPPQEAVNEFTGGPSSCDLVIGVLRHVFGSELPPKRFGTRPDGQPWACTEWELHSAIEAAKQGLVKDVLVFRDTSSLVRTGKTQQQRDADTAELARVDDYLQRNPDQRTHEHEGVDGLRVMFPGLLDAWLDQYLKTPEAPQAAWTTSAEHLTPDQQALLDALLAEPEDPPPPDADRRRLTDAVKRTEVQGLRGYLLRRYAEWCSTEGGRLDRRFVRLTLLVNQGRDAEGEQFLLQGERGSFDRLDTLLARHAGVEGWVLVGEPGSGKSTLLQHHELRTARAALRALAHDPAARPEVCFWQRLSHFDASEAARTRQTPAQWLAEQWQAQWGDALPLAEVQRRVRLRWVLDGFNEIRYSDAADYDAAAVAWRQWAADCATRQALPQPAPLFSVRTKDEADLGRTVRRIDIERWSVAQVRDYCRGRFNGMPPAAAAADPPLYVALSRKGNEAVLALCRLPFNLAAQCTLFEHLGRPARNRVELISGLVWLGLHRDRDKAHLRPAGLLTRYDRERLRDEDWRSDLLALPAEGRLVPWLDQVAEQMHRDGQGHTVSERSGLVLRRLPQEVAPQQRDDWLHAVQRLGWWDRSGTDRKTSQPVLRFTHQLWQEFFAARRLCDLLEDRPDELPDLRPPPLPDLAEVVAGLGAQQPLLGPKANLWEEAIRQVVQFDHQDRVAWLDVVRAVNLPMAGRAAVACLAALEAEARGPALLETLRGELLARSRDPLQDLRLRIEAGEVLGELGDPRYERHPSGCLLPRQWVCIEGGTYTIGNDSGPADEQPATPVELAPFEMAFAPVTNAEYRCFIEAGGYGDGPWWDSPAARQWREGQHRSEGAIKEFRNVIEQLRSDPALVASLPKANREHAELLLSWSSEQIEAEIEKQYGARVRHEPEFWHNPLFNRPSQPVVGLSVYEAQAYAHWLSERTRRSFSLPTEAQWEVAARGAERRRWPWRGDDPEPGQINADESHLRRTTPVGVFPAADTPEGLTDMAGNVWEWTLSRYTAEGLERDALNATVADDGTTDDGAPALRVLRGGSWGFVSADCRAASRGRLAPVNRHHHVGVRLVSGPIRSTAP